MNYIWMVTLVLNKLRESKRSEQSFFFYVQELFVAVAINIQDTLQAEATFSRYRVHSGYKF